MSTPMASFTPLGLVSHENIRFDGKNFHRWEQKMEFLLKQLKIAYVLTEPCPTIPLSPGATDADIAQVTSEIQKWIDDDYLCRHNILNSLTDQLYDQYSIKTKNAKDLWESLKIVYTAEQFGIKKFQVSNYVEFKMNDEKLIIEQVQELQKIADSITAAGMTLDENFHVSVIISKLPPAWKDY